MSNDILLSTAMLNAIWSAKRKDTLDLLCPFAEYAIGKTARNDGCVDVEAASRELNGLLGYKSLPHSVVVSLLNRLTPSVLTKNHGAYWLNGSLAPKVASFKKQRASLRERNEKVGEALAEYLNAHMVGKCYDCESALEALAQFFRVSGLLVENDTSKIEAIQKGPNPVSYHVGQFVLAQSGERSIAFSYIVDMVKGFFVSAVLYMRPTGIDMQASKFKDTVCYLDTRILLNALDMNSHEEYVSAQEFLNMLTGQNAQVACFEHTVEEIKSIILAYRAALMRNGGRRSEYGHTLDGWNERRYSVDDIDVFLMSLVPKLHMLGVSIEGKPSPTEWKRYPVDEKKLDADLRSSMKYNNDVALRRDIDSVSSVCILRDGLAPRSIERCRAVFVTPNAQLARVVCKSVGSNGREHVPAVVTDTELAAILWLKGCSAYGDYPRTKLIENASLALEPDEEIMRKFYDIVDHMEKRGGVSPEEADAIRVGLFRKRELMDSIGGNPDNLGEVSVRAIQRNLKHVYGKQAGAQIAKANSERDAGLDRIRKNEESALLVIREAGEKVFNLTRAVGKVVVFGLMAVVFVSFLYFLLGTLLFQEQANWPVVAVTVVLDVVAVWDLAFGKKRILMGLVDWVASWASDREKDRVRKRYSFIFENE